MPGSYETIRTNELRLEKEIRFAQRVQAALLPTELPKRMKQVDVAARFEPARELGGDLYNFLAPEPNSLVIAVGDVSGKGVPAALTAPSPESWCGRARSVGATPPIRSGPATVTGVDEHDPVRAAAGGVLLHAALTVFDFKRRTVTLGKCRLSVSDPQAARRPDRQAAGDADRAARCSAGYRSRGSNYDEVVLDVKDGRPVRVLQRRSRPRREDSLLREFGSSACQVIVTRCTAFRARDRATASSTRSASFAATCAERRHDGSRRRSITG